MATPKQYLTAQQAAEIAGKSPRTITLYCHNGKLEATREKDGWRISRGALRSYMAAEKKAAKERLKAVKVKKGGK